MAGIIAGAEQEAGQRFHYRLRKHGALRARICRYLLLVQVSHRVRDFYLYRASYSSKEKPGPAAAKISARDLKDLWSLAKGVDAEDSARALQRSNDSDPTTSSEPSDEEEGVIDVEYHHRWGEKPKAPEHDFVPAALLVRLLMLSAGLCSSSSYFSTSSISTTPVPVASRILIIHLRSHANDGLHQTPANICCDCSLCREWPCICTVALSYGRRVVWIVKAPMVW